MSKKITPIRRYLGYKIRMTGSWFQDENNSGYFSSTRSTAILMDKWQTSYHLPQSQLQINGSLILSGPTDKFKALGKNDQKINVIPS